MDVADADPLATRDRPRVYYGWVNVGVAAVAMTATLPGRTFGLGLIKDGVCRDLGLGDQQFSRLNFWAVVVGSAAALPVGRLIDRVGGRVVTAGVALGLGASVLAMSRAADEPSLLASLTAVRGLGQAALSVAALALVGKWFRRRLPMAMGAFSVAVGIGFAAAQSAITPAVDAAGWRAAWAVVGWCLVAFAVAAGLAARSTPEAAGVRPDDPAPGGDRPATGATLWAALRAPAFWVYSAAGAHLNLVFSAVTLDNQQLLRERGLTARGASEATLAALFLTGLAANFFAGWLSRRAPLRHLLAGGSGLLAGSVAFFPFVATVPAAAGYGALLGASGGVVTVAYFAIYGRSFGRAHLGAVQAAAQVCTVFASAVGPVLLAAVRDGTGRTDAFFYGCSAAAAVLGVLCWAVRASAPPSEDA